MIFFFLISDAPNSLPESGVCSLKTSHHSGISPLRSLLYRRQRDFLQRPRLEAGVLMGEAVDPAPVQAAGGPGVGQALGSGGGRQAQGGLESLLTVSGARRPRRARPSRSGRKGAAEQGVGPGGTGGR